MEIAPAAAEPTIQDGSTWTGSDAAKGIAPSVINASPIIKLTGPDLRSRVVGSAVAGALSMAFGCTLMAPHGGIFVVPVMGNAGMYLVALAVGTVISAVLLGLLKKKVNE